MLFVCGILWLVLDWVIVCEIVGFVEFRGLFFYLLV